MDRNVTPWLGIQYAPGGKIYHFKTSDVQCVIPVFSVSAIVEENQQNPFVFGMVTLPYERSKIHTMIDWLGLQDGEARKWHSNTPMLLIPKQADWQPLIALPCYTIEAAQDLNLSETTEISIDSIIQKLFNR